MFFRWWRDRRRRRLSTEPFPAEWLRIIEGNCRHFAGLNTSEQKRLLRDTRWFLAEKKIQGAFGLTLTDEMRVTIAAHASLMGLGFPDPPFDRLISVIVRSESYVMQTTRSYGAGLEIVSDEARIGEAWRHGPVVLSWEDIQQQCRDEPDGRNVILHEFAHLLDMLNVEIDGVPVLNSDQQYREWKEVTGAEYARLVRETKRGRETLIDPYGAESPIEFFAVVSECFFEEGAELGEEHPGLYKVFRDYYRQDPARRSVSF